MKKVQEIEYKGRDIDLVFTDPTYEEEVRETKAFREIKVLEGISALGLTGTAIDIGANTGNSVVYLANFCDFDRIFAIEPNNESINVLYRNIKQNPSAAEVTIFEAAMWDTRGICGITQKEESGKNEITAGENVEMYTLDSVVEKYIGGQYISLLNISTYLNEDKVLRGAERVIRRFKPEVFVESTNDPFDLLKNFPKFVDGEYKVVTRLLDTDYYYFSYFRFA